MARGLLYLLNGGSQRVYAVHDSIVQHLLLRLELIVAFFLKMPELPSLIDSISSAASPSKSIIEMQISPPLTAHSPECEDTWHSSG